MRTIDHLMSEIANSFENALDGLDRRFLDGSTQKFLQICQYSSHASYYDQFHDLKIEISCSCHVTENGDDENVSQHCHFEFFFVGRSTVTFFFFFF